MRKFGKALLGGILGYGLGVAVGIGLVSALGSPRPDSSQEAVMTGFFFVGPVVGLLAFLGTLIHQLRRRPPSSRLGLAFILVVLSATLSAATVAAQTRPAPVQDPEATAKGARPIPGPVYETRNFTRAVERGTRDRTGRPGASHWTQRARYDINARLDPAKQRLTGSERVVYQNRSPDTLLAVPVYLRQNLFAPGSPRRESAPITGGVTLTHVEAQGIALRPAKLDSDSGPPGYEVNATVMWIRLPHSILPGDSATFAFEWSFTPPPSPSDGRQGREDDVYFLGYWYPQLAVYDDINGWVTDPYINGAEFYMDMADYDVRLTVPRGWVVGATGTLRDSASVLTPRTVDRLEAIRGSRNVAHIIAASDLNTSNALVSKGSTSTWHFTASNVRDFSWGTGNHYLWDATSALVPKRAGGTVDTVAIHSFFRVSAAAAAWPIGGARFTRDAIEQLSLYLWPYPWPQMTSMEGVLTSGGMEYPMMTLMQPWADTLSLAGDLMHETGHMWFPMQVGSNETRHAWMDEGLTQFNTAQAMRALYKEPRSGGRPNDSEQGQRASYTRAARNGNDAPLMLWSDLFPLNLYFISNYNKTAQVLVALRAVLGDSTFHRALIEYGSRWTGRHPDPADFFNTFDNVSGRDLGWFWVSWFYQAWPLDQAIASVVEDGDSMVITVEDRGLVPMPVNLSVTRADGTVLHISIPVEEWLTGRRTITGRVARSPEVIRVQIDAENAFPDLNRGNQGWVKGAGAR